FSGLIYKSPFRILLSCRQRIDKIPDSFKRSTDNRIAKLVNKTPFMVGSNFCKTVYKRFRFIPYKIIYLLTSIFINKLETGARQFNSLNGRLAINDVGNQEN